MLGIAPTFQHYCQGWSMGNLDRFWDARPIESPQQHSAACGRLRWAADPGPWATADGRYAAGPQSVSSQLGLLDVHGAWLCHVLRSCSAHCRTQTWEGQLWIKEWSWNSCSKNLMRCPGVHKLTFADNSSWAWHCLSTFTNGYNIAMPVNSVWLGLPVATCSCFFFALCSRIGLERKEGGRDAARDRGWGQSSDACMTVVVQRFAANHGQSIRIH